MEVISYSLLRNNLASFLDKVNENHTPLLITRQNSSSAVLLSLEDFNAYQETAYLMSSKRNAKRLNESVEQINQLTNLFEKELIE